MLAVHVNISIYTPLNTAQLCKETSTLAFHASSTIPKPSPTLSSLILSLSRLPAGGQRHQQRSRQATGVS